MQVHEENQISRGVLRNHDITPKMEEENSSDNTSPLEAYVRGRKA